MVSGIKPDDDLQNLYNDLCLNRKLKAMILKIEKIDKNGVKEETILVENKYEPDTFQHDDFVNALPTNEARFALLNFEGEADDGRKIEKIVLILWAPDLAKPFNKMLYSSSCRALEDNFKAISKTMQASVATQISYEELRKELAK